MSLTTKVKWKDRIGFWNGITKLFKLLASYLATIYIYLHCKKNSVPQTPNLVSEVCPNTDTKIGVSSTL